MTLRFGQFYLDTERLELRHNDRPVTIEPQVFDLLRLLIENRDRVVSKDEIIDVVWSGRIVSEAALSSRVNALRRALGDDGNRQEYIRTLRRRGFRFIYPDVIDESPTEDRNKTTDIEARGASDPARDIGRLPLPEKPSIAVLPFTNLSGDRDQDYFAEGIADDIITALSRFHWFFVIARNSSFTYRGKTVDHQVVARELGVQYLLDGSVRRDSNRVRIVAHLIDAPTGRYIWTERYDRDLHDIFAVQDEIAGAISSAISPSFALAEALRIQNKAPESFDAWDYAIRGNWHLWHLDKDSLSQARKNFEAAIEIDPMSVLALSGLALTCSWQVVWGWAGDPSETRELADKSARRAVAANEYDAWAQAALSTVHLHRRRLELAERAARRAVELNPNMAFAELALGAALGWSGQYDEAIERINSAERLSPRDPAHSWFTLQRACAAFVAGDYKEQIKWAEWMTQTAPDHPAGWRMLAAGCGLLDRRAQAEQAVRGLQRVVPHFTLELAKTSTTGIRDDDLERLVDGLRRAGVPE